MKPRTSTIRMFLLLGLLSPCAPPAPAATEPGELQVRLDALDGQAPEALWNTVQELAGKLTESFGTQLAEVLNDEGFFDKGQEYRFVAAALALALQVFADDQKARVFAL